MKNEEDLGRVAEGCYLEIRDTNLSSLDGLGALKKLQAVSMDDNPVLDDISALNGIVEDFPLAAESTRLAGALELPAAADDILLANVAATSLQSSRSVLSLTLQRSPALTTLAFANATTLQSLTLEELPLLDGLAAAFPQLEEVKAIRIRECPNVTVAEIDAIAGVLSEGGSINHCGNADDAPCD